jgi:hypothetical protein
MPPCADVVIAVGSYPIESNLVVGSTPTGGTKKDHFKWSFFNYSTSLVGISSTITS